jgi:hypothetical protein
MSKNHIKEGMLFTIVLMLLSTGLSLGVFAQEDSIPMPGDDAIPLPGDDIVPLPGDDTIPLPGEESEIPPPATSIADVSLPLEFRGYVENTTNVEYIKEQEEEILLNAGRIRLNLSGKPDDSLDFGIGFVGTINKGATEISLLNYMPDGVQNRIIPGSEELFAWQLEDKDIFVQEAFGTLYTDHFRLRVGRHKFYTGTGYAYNPIDLFNVKDPLDPTYETNGLDALLISIDLPKQTELQGMVRYADHFDTTDYLARLKTYISGWDIALQYTHSLKKRVDWEALNTEETLAELMLGRSFADFTREFRWHLVAAEFSGELWEWAVYGEGGYVFIDEPNDIGHLADAAKDHERLLLGVDHTFEFQLYFLIEYLRIGQGRTNIADITLNDRMAYFNGEILSIDRDTLFTGISYPLTDLIEGSVYAIVGLNDSNVLLNPWLIYDVRPGLKLSLNANIPFGDEEGQNGKSGVSGFVRLKFHF